MLELEEIGVRFLIHCGSEENSARRLCGIRLLQMLIAAFAAALFGGEVYFGGLESVRDWANLLLLGLTPYASWGCATKSGFVRDVLPPEVTAAICRCIRVVQSLYAFAALPTIFNTYWSIAFIVLLQLYLPLRRGSDATYELSLAAFEATT